MSASRDEKTGKWTAQCYYENWKGEKKHKKKRGFATKKEALEWEREFLKSTSSNMDMMLGAFVDVYFRDKAGELKERTIKNKRYMIEAHVLPYFENKQMNEISPSDIIQCRTLSEQKGIRRLIYAWCKIRLQHCLLMQVTFTISTITHVKRLRKWESLTLTS